MKLDYEVQYLSPKKRYPNSRKKLKQRRIKRYLYKYTYRYMKRKDLCK